MTGMPSFTGKARRSALHTSSAASLRHCSGPLQMGHTRISSSLGSIGSPAEFGDAREEEFFELARKDRLHAQEPHARVGECSAFYGILFGHEDEVGAGKLEIARLVVVVVGHGDAARRDAEL